MSTQQLIQHWNNAGYFWATSTFAPMKAFYWRRMQKLARQIKKKQGEGK